MFRGFLYDLTPQCANVGQEKWVRRQEQDRRPALRCLSGLRQGQRDRKGAPLAHDTLHRHLAAMRGDHLLHDIQP